MATAAPMSDAAIDYTIRRIHRLPATIEAAERKLAGLYREAQRYGMDELLESHSAFSEAWDRELAVAKLEASLRGNDETTMQGSGI